MFARVLFVQTSSSCVGSAHAATSRADQNTQPVEWKEEEAIFISVRRTHVPSAVDDDIKAIL